MPPPVEEIEESSADEIPFADAKENGADEEEDEPSEGEPDEYVVEKILRHDWLDDGVKWQGYDDPKDRTWEPEANLETAEEILEAYFKKIGGHPSKHPPTSTKKGKKRGAEAVDTPKSGTKSNKKGKHDSTEVSTSSRKKKIEKGEDNWEPPHGTWEKDIVNIDTIEEVFDAAEGVNKRYAYVVWLNGRKTRHLLPTLNLKCPLKMLQYYENHLVFRTSSTNGDSLSEKTEQTVSKTEE